MEEVINYIKSLNINSNVVLACSYGPDSMCLLDILNKLGIKVIVAHVNHKLREESDLEYELLKNRQNESGKSQSEVLKESLYREQDIMDAKFSDSIFRIACWIEEREYDKIREEVKKYADYQIRERK